MSPSQDAPHGASAPIPLSAQAALLAQMEEGAGPLLDDLVRLLPGFQESGTTLAESKELEADDIESLYEMGHGLFLQEAWRDALTVFIHLTAHDPFDLRFQFAVGMCFQQLEDPLAATVAYSQALMLSPERADIAYRLGEALADAGQTEQAGQILKAARDLINENFDLYHHLQGPTEDKLRSLEPSETQE